MVHLRAAILALMAVAALGWALAASAQEADTEVLTQKTPEQTAREKAEQLLVEKAEKTGKAAWKLYQAGKVEEAFDLLWRTAGELPAGRVSDELRNYALLMRLRKFLENGENQEAVESAIAQATALRAATPKEWALLDAGSLYVLVGDYDRASKTFQGILKDYGPPTKEEVAAFKKEIEEKYGKGIKVPHERVILREEAESRLKQLALIGKPAPAFELTTLDGQKVSPAAFKGKILLLDFWATWCTPCLEDMPRLKKLSAEYADAGFEILGLSSDEDKEKLAQFVGDTAMGWKQVFLGDTPKKLHPVHGLYLTGGNLPANYLIDRKGVVRGIQMRGAVLDMKLKALLEAEKPE